MTIHKFSFIFTDSISRRAAFYEYSNNKKKNKILQEKAVKKVNVGCKNRVINYNKMAGRRKVMQL